MRKLKMLITAVAAGSIAAMTLAGCGKADNANPKPEDYIELGLYKGLEYNMPSGDVTEDEIEDEMAYLAGSFSTQEEITEGEVQSGDVANIDYEGKLDGVAFDGGTAAGYDLTIGSHTFIDGFEDGLVGVAIGDTVDLNLTFPEDYGASELAGQDVVFTVKVNYVTRDNIPDITDDFIEEISEGQYTNVEDYRAALEEQMKSENLEYLEQQIYTDLLKMAVENASVKSEIPQEYVQAKVARMLINVQDYAEAYNMDLDSFLEQYMGMTKDEYNTQSVEYAKDAAKESLVIRAIADAEGISVSDEEMQKAIDEYVEQYGYEDEEDFKSQTNMDDFEEYILTSKVEDFLYENANIIREE